MTEKLISLKQLIEKNRSYRRFYQSHAVNTQTLTELVELASLAPSGRNMQPLKYLLSSDAELNAKIYPTLAWAGYIKDWNGPKEGERPAAYIVQLGDTLLSKNYFCDQGFAAQNILLGAVELGLGCCVIASVKRKELTQILQLPEHLEILQVIAIGKPKETVVLEKMTDGIEYWRSEDGVHHVPKRGVDELIVLKA